MLGYEEKLERIELIDAVCDAARILEAQNEVLYAEERANAKPRENER